MTTKNSRTSMNGRLAYIMGTIQVCILTDGSKRPKLRLAMHRIDRQDDDPIWNVIQSLTPSEYMQLNRRFVEVIDKFKKQGELHPPLLERK